MPHLWRGGALTGSLTRCFYCGGPVDAGHWPGWPLIAERRLRTIVGKPDEKGRFYLPKGLEFAVILAHTQLDVDGMVSVTLASGTFPQVPLGERIPVEYLGEEP